jgi:hypothetical protein
MDRLNSIEDHGAGGTERVSSVYVPPVPTKNSEGVEKSGDLLRSAIMSPACSLFSRNSSHGSPVGFAAA